MPNQITSLSPSDVTSYTPPLVHQLLRQAASAFPGISGSALQTAQVKSMLSADSSAARSSFNAGWSVDIISRPTANHSNSCSFTSPGTLHPFRGQIWMTHLLSVMQAL